jgi:predicted negative regulator of RcsB-dependent stress response
MNENILTFNVTNLITVCLMAAIGFAVVGFAQNWWTTRQDSQAQLAAAA